MRSIWRACVSVALAFVVVGSVGGQEIANEPRRETRQRVPDLLAAMDVREGSVVGDIGATSGRFLFHRRMV
jgi:hypothetical protein